MDGGAHRVEILPVADSVANDAWRLNQDKRCKFRLDAVCLSSSSTYLRIFLFGWAKGWRCVCKYPWYLMSMICNLPAWHSSHFLCLAAERGWAAN
jgi:hypothetical protein